ncbi:MAG: hypothetical protein JWN44_164 [Myxococcales bacterium]|nr:hypothetical protein [Myxococcales bacterium]
MIRMSLALAVVAVTAHAAHAERRWLRANFHAHATTEALVDDGSESAEALHRAVRAAGFDFSLHTPHCDSSTATAEAFVAQREAESKLNVAGLTIAVGQELTVANGPSFERRTRVLGQSAPGNLDHLTIFGHKALVGFRALTPADACERVHRDGGVCIVNHPGPGPMMWEEGYWEAPKNRARIDALEVYNGQALAAVAIDFESRYREATAYRGLGIKIAATTGADTHGPTSVARAQARLAGLAGAASKLVKLMMPAPTSARPELLAATLVWADGTRTEDVLAAVKARRTVATYALEGLRVTLDGLGEVRKSGAVKLRLGLSRKLAEVTLYREGVAVQSWRDVDVAEWSETISAPAAYVFAARDGAGRMMTSAIWYEP